MLDNVARLDRNINARPYARLRSGLDTIEPLVLVPPRGQETSVSLIASLGQVQEILEGRARVVSRVQSCSIAGRSVFVFEAQAVTVDQVFENLVLGEIDEVDDAAVADGFVGGFPVGGFALGGAVERLGAGGAGFELFRFAVLGLVARCAFSYSGRSVDGRSGVWLGGLLLLGLGDEWRRLNEHRWWW